MAKDTKPKSASKPTEPARSKPVAKAKLAAQPKVVAKPVKTPVKTAAKPAVETAKSVPRKADKTKTAAAIAKPPAPMPAAKAAKPGVAPPAAAPAKAARPAAGRAVPAPAAPEPAAAKPKPAVQPKPAIQPKPAVQPKRDEMSVPKPKPEAGPKIETKRKPEVKSSAPPSKPPRRAEFGVGDFIVYPTHGVGSIVAIEEQEIAGMQLKLFVIEFAKEKMTLRVPLAKAATVGMRRLSSPDIMKSALQTLKGRARVKRTMWSRRAQEYEAKINSGDPVSIAEVVRDLHRNAGQPEQSYSERQIYESALDRLSRELAAVEGLNENEAAERLEEVLRAA